MNVRRSTAAIATALIAVLAAGGCASDETPEASSGSASASADSGTESDAAITAADGWVKAVKADMKMTGVFVTLTNTTDEDVTIVSATTDMSDKAELHEMVSKDGQMVMQETEDGLTVPANGTLELKPGGFHIMVMMLSEDVVAGDKHTVTLELEDGSTVEFDAIAKDFAGANESYHGGS